MCLLIFIGADHSLPLKPWQDDKHDFYVRALSEKEKIIRNYFSVPHIRYVGTEEGCGCPFNYGREYPQCEDDPDELALAERSLYKLVEYIKTNKVQQIFSCWGGEFEKPPKNSRKIKVEYILQKDFIFKEQELLTIIIY